MKKRVFAIVLFVFVLISIGFVFAVTNSTIACYNDSDCGISNSSYYCSGNNSCFGGVSYYCSNPGTINSSCGGGGGGGCGICINGCNLSSGRCNQLAHTYILDKDFGGIYFNVGSIERGITADGVDILATLFPNFIDGASGKYTVQNTSYNPDMFVVIAEFNNDISYNDFINNYLNLYSQQSGNYSIDCDPVSGSLPDAQMCGIVYYGLNGEQQTTFAWVSHNKFIIISFQDYRALDSENLQQDFITMFYEYIAEYPSTLVETGCATHQISISEIKNNSGNIDVSFKEKNVSISNVKISLSASFDGGGWEAKCNIVGPTGCGGGGGSGDGLGYCTVSTDCQYPSRDPNTKYFVTVKDNECNGVIDTAEVYPEYSKTIQLLKGWNLVSAYSLQNVFDQNAEIELNDIGIRAVFLYDRYNKDYIRLHPNKEQAKLDDFIKNLMDESGTNLSEFAAFVHSSIWVYSNRIQELKFNVYDTPFLEDARMVSGWNFLAVTPQMIGKSLNQWKGNCNIIKAAFWSPEYKKWDIGSGSDFDQVFTEELLWKGLVVKTSGECYLGDSLQPPELPEDNCTDSDGGLNYFVKGTLVNQNGVYDDYCMNSSSTLIERYCSDDPNVFTSQFICSNGCYEGACVQEATCTDSDGGLDIFTYGWTDFKSGDFEFINTDKCALVTDYMNGTPSGWQSTDSCTGNDCYVEEAFCRTDGNGHFIDADADELILCSGGCTNGTCVGETNYLLRVYSIANSSANYHDDIVKLKEVNTQEIYQAIITSEGHGTISMIGNVYDLNYSAPIIGNLTSDDYYIQLSDASGNTKGGNRVYKNGYIIIGTGNPIRPPGSYLYKIFDIYNSTSSDYSADRVTLQDTTSGDTFQATLTSEGHGTITLVGKSYNVKYYASQTVSSDYYYIKLTNYLGDIAGGGSRVYKRGYILIYD